MKLLIVDDHQILLEGLASALRQAVPEAAICQAQSAEEGLRVAELTPDLDAVLLDLAMPGLSGMAAILEFGKKRPDLPVIVLSSSEDQDDVRHALASGALGYVPKSAGLQTLLAAIHLVLTGNVYVPPLMLERTNSTDFGGDIAGETAAPSGLTERQIEVLRLICRGLSNKGIGRTLGLSDKTVKSHITLIFKTLNVMNRTQAANIARLNKLI